MSLFRIPEEFMPAPTAFADMFSFSRSAAPLWPEMKLPRADWSSLRSFDASGFGIPAMPAMPAHPVVGLAAPMAAAATAAALAPAIWFGWWGAMGEIMNQAREETGTRPAAPARPVERKSPAAAPETVSGKPQGLASARGGKADDLKMISGVGPKIEKTLHSLGIFHFDQIAAWTGTEIAWVDDYLKFSGRILRDDWIGQAAALARGGRDEYVKVFGKEPR